MNGSVHDTEEASCVSNDSIVIDARIEQVFETLVDFEQLPSWMPFVRRVAVVPNSTNGPAGKDAAPPDARHRAEALVGTTRLMSPAIGPPTHERIIEVTWPERLVYSATDETLHGLLVNHRAEIECGRLASNQTRVDWRTFGRRSDALLLGRIGPAVIRWVVRTSLRRLRNRLEAT